MSGHSRGSYPGDLIIDPNGRLHTDDLVITTSDGDIGDFRLFDSAVNPRRDPQPDGDFFCSLSDLDGMARYCRNETHQSALAPRSNAPTDAEPSSSDERVRRWAEDVSSTALTGRCNASHLKMPMISEPFEMHKTSDQRFRPLFESAQRSARSRSATRVDPRRSASCFPCFSSTRLWSPTFQAPRATTWEVSSGPRLMSYSWTARGSQRSRN